MAGLIGTVRTSRRGAATGVWTLDEQVGYQRQGTWIGEADFGSVSLLLHMDGSNGSTTFTDSSSNALTITPAGNAQISTAQSKFGGSSAYFDGTGDGLSISSTTALQFGTSAFTLECWIYTTATPASGTKAQIIGRHNVGGSADWVFYLNSLRRPAIYFESTFATINGTTTVPLNTWTHVAATRQGNTCYLFVDGTLSTSASFTGSTEAGATGTYDIGADQGANDATFTGYIDDLRVTKGARYTSNFTVPSSPFPNS